MPLTTQTWPDSWRRQSRASQVSSSSKTQILTQHQDIKKQMDDDFKQAAVWQRCVRSEVLKEHLAEEQENKLELQHLLSKLNTEVTHWRTRHEANAIQPYPGGIVRSPSSVGSEVRRSSTTLPAPLCQPISSP
ncbi:putative uncharacterized protein MYH16 [Coregonus clupeaformis]|uniref:putative uncharacterized protein MYH16 n=1 Tax=Coregonus clupeaformis TaxID=59861 RepID=UPI001E1C8ADB|nr:putative uncharacterized protein MYH16 [Coregonus clupeaformis]